MGMRDAVLELFGSVWPRLPGAIETARVWAADWWAVSTPFVVWDSGRAVAHAGVIEMPLRIAGRDVAVGGVHAVCVHPDFRGRGLARRALESALAHVDGRYQTAILWSEKVALYQRFGFRPFHESVFRGSVTPRRASARRLSLPADVTLVRELLAARAPVSDRLATREPGWHFLIDLALWPEAREWLWLLDEPRALVVAETRAGALYVHDWVSSAPLDVAAISGALSESQLELHVMPPAGATFGPAPSPLEDVLMVRGVWPDELAPACLSPLCRC